MFQVVRRVGADGVWAPGGYRLVRQVGADGGWAPAGNPPGWRIVRLPSGPAGAPGRSGFTFSFNGLLFRTAEELPGYPIVAPIDLVAANCLALTRTPPDATRVFQILRNDAEAVGTITFTAGAVDPATGYRLGTVALTVTALVREDYVYLVAPDPADSTMRHMSATLAGAL